MKKIYLFSTVVLLFSMLFCLSSCTIPQITKTYNIVFEVDDQTYYAQTVTEGGYVTEPIEPKKSGYDFVGWYNNSRKWNFNFDTVKSNMLLEAKWQINFEYMFRRWNGTPGVKIGNDGSYLELDTNPYDDGEYISYEIMEKIEEANKKLGFPDSLYLKMLKTSVQEGRQTDSNENITVKWIYHPEYGLEIIYESKN